MATTWFPNLRCVHAWSLVGVLVLAGCGRVGFSTADPRDDAAPGGDCWASWRSGSPPLSEASPVTGKINTKYTEKNPFLTADRTTLYFSSNRPGGPGKNDFWRATRGSPELAFGDAELVVELSSPEDDGRFELSPDGVTGVLSSQRPPTTGSTGSYDLWLAMRSDPTAAFAVTPIPSKVNSETDDKDPHFSRDGARLYFSSGSQSLRVAERSGTTFPSSTVLPGLENVEGAGDPNLSPDELAIVFSKRQPGAETIDLYLATRQSTAEPFGVHTALTVVNTDDHIEQDAFLSGDGCELWFASDRGGAGFDIYVATMMR